MSGIKGKDIIVIYSGEWIGKGIDEIVTAYAPLQAQIVKVTLATAFPLLSIAPQIKNDTIKNVLLLAGAFLATKA